MTFASFLCAVDLVDLEHNTFGGFGRFSEDLVDLAKRWIWTFAPNPPPRLYKTRKVDLDSVTEKLAKTLEVDLVDLDFKFAKTSKVDLKGFEHRCDIWRSRGKHRSHAGISNVSNCIGKLFRVRPDKSSWIVSFSKV